MSLSRSFTGRSRSSNETAKMPTVLTKSSLRTFDRSKISTPVFLSSTNIEAVNAQSIEVAQKLRKVSSISSASSRSSDKDSDSSSTSPRSRGTSVTDSSSVGSSPSSPRPSDGSSYFGSAKISAGPRRAASSADIKRRAASFEPTPIVPLRAPSHSKVAHETLARKRSLQTLNTWQEPARSVPPGSQQTRPMGLARQSSTGSVETTRSGPGRETRASRDFFNHRGLEQTAHPFGKELEQLDEIAEEFGGAVRDAEREQDLTFMRQRNLVKLSAMDYMRDIEPIFQYFFHRQPTQTTPLSAGWI